MSTTKIPTIDDIYANAEKQKKANAQVEQLAKDNNAAKALEDTEALNKSVEAAKKKTDAYYDEIYDANAVNQYISERRVAESMANMGLTDSGLNATQKVAIETGRGNADNRARLQEQAAIDDIELKLTEGLAEIKRTQRENDAIAEANRIKADAEAETKAIDDANQWVKDQNQLATDAADERAKQIKAATDAVINMKAASKTDNDIARNISHYAEQYDLSETEIRTMCGNAGVTYETYKAIVPSQEDFSNYLTKYNVTETGEAKLIPKLVTDGVLADTDISYVKNLFAKNIKGKTALQGTSVETSRKIDSWLADGKITANAASYMKALMAHHGLSYVKGTFTAGEYEQAAANVKAQPILVTSYKTFVDSFVNQFYNGKDSKDTLQIMNNKNILTKGDVDFIDMFYTEWCNRPKDEGLSTEIMSSLIMHYNAGDISLNARQFLIALFDV